MTSRAFRALVDAPSSELDACMRRGQPPDVERLAGVEQVDTLEWNRPLARHDADTDERGDQSSVGRGVEQLPQPAGVVAVA